MAGARGVVLRDLVEAEVEVRAWRRMSAMAVVREWWPDCWTRVLRRSIGCRRTAEQTPEPRPAAKWKAGRERKG